MNSPESWKHSADRILLGMDCIVGGWKKNGEEMSLSAADRTSLTAVDIRNREPLLMSPVVAPWNTQKVSLISFQVDLNCVKSDPVEVKKRTSLDKIASLGKFDIEVWTDGSMVGKIGAGAGVIRVCKTGAEYNAEAPSGFLSSSFRAELVALHAVLAKMMTLKALKLPGKSVLFCSDSKSMITALAGGPLRNGGELLSKVWGLLIQLVENMGVRKVVFQFVYAHCGVEGNELADKLADAALKGFKTSDQRNAAIPLQAVKAMVKLGCRDKWKSDLNEERHRYQVCGRDFTDLKKSGTFSRKDEVALAQLRTGESKLMGKFRTRLGIGSPLCRWCKVDEETVQHVYTHCVNVGVELLRRRLNVEDVRILHTKPEIGLIFCREALNLL